jgi:sulfofructosephosphate aldolase
MTSLSTLERRAMTRISTSSGRLLIVAADQRNGMKAVMVDPADPTQSPESITPTQLAEAKSDIVTHLGNHAPAILLDPVVALPGVVDDGTLAPDTGLVVGMDASGFQTRQGLRYTQYVEGVTPRSVRDLGGDAAKMLFYLRPDQQDENSEAASQIRDLVDACASEGVLLIVEILTYRLEDEDEQTYASLFPQLVIDAARIGASCGARILKLPYPGSAEASSAVTAAAGDTPWAVLSAGVDHSTFAGQVAAAVSAGASGAMAGRSLWKDSLSTSPTLRSTLLTDRALPRLRELQSILGTAARQPGNGAQSLTSV